MLGGGLVLVPTFAIAWLGVHAIGEPDWAIANVLVPGLLGVLAGGVVNIGLRQRAASDESTRPWRETGGAVAVMVVALLGTTSDVLPIYVQSIINGAVLGFFASFAVVLVTMWKRDAEFRARLTRVWTAEDD